MVDATCQVFPFEHKLILWFCRMAPSTWRRRQNCLNTLFLICMMRSAHYMCFLMQSLWSLQLYAYYCTLQSQEVAKGFRAVCTPEFYLFKKVTTSTRMLVIYEFMMLICSVSRFSCVTSFLISYLSKFCARMGEGHLNFFTMGNLMIQDPVTMCQSPEGILWIDAQTLQVTMCSYSFATCRDLSRAIDCALSGQELPFDQKPRYV